jgi:hypothetical protein
MMLAAMGPGSCASLRGECQLGWLDVALKASPLHGGTSASSFARPMPLSRKRNIPQ